MKRQIIHIDQEKCNGCGACAAACHEGAIAMVGGKATLMRDDYCDGLGDCLPACPMDAIHFCFPVYHTDCPFVTGLSTGTTTVTFIFLYLNHSSDHIRFLLIFCMHS